MEIQHSGQKIKQVRESKGWSQEVLAEKTKLSLRTIQRIEQGHSQLRGNTLLQIKQVLFPDEETPFKDEKCKNRNLLTILNLSALSYLIFPIINIIIPGIIWIASPEKDHHFNKNAKSTLLIQTFWCCVLIIGFFLIRYINSYMFLKDGNVTAMKVITTEWLIIGWFSGMYLLNLCVIIVRSIRCNTSCKIAKI
jgi:transcriptional regulator with XRE-family HTH domain